MDASMDRHGHHGFGGTSISPMRENSKNIMNISHNHKHSTSQIKASEINKDKESRYQDKIRQLKNENKKIVSLLKDSERLFYHKL